MSILRIHHPLAALVAFSVAAGAFVLRCELSAQVVTNTTEQFTLLTTTIKIPRAQPQFSSTALATNTTNYVLRCWLNTPSSKPRALTTNRAPESERSPFRTIASLAVAYRSGSIDDVISLYNVQSQELIRKRLAAPELRERWLSGVTSIESLEPLVIWEQANGFNCVAESTRSGTSNSGKRTLMMLRFDSDFNLVIDDVSSPITQVLLAYLSDKSRNPMELVAEGEGKTRSSSPER